MKAFLRINPSTLNGAPPPQQMSCSTLARQPKSPADGMNQGDDVFFSVNRQKFPNKKKGGKILCLIFSVSRQNFFAEKKKEP